MERRVGMKRDDLSPFALRLRTLRKQAHMRQEDVAKMLNLTRTAYTKYENDHAKPEQSRLVSLAELFGVSVDFLLGKETDESTPALADPTAPTVTVELTPREQELLTAFRRLTPAQQDTLLQKGHTMVEETRAETE
jgi:transcriptional regulator with XRE-family HTH domain